ncbi:YjdF family protein [Aminipila sp.]|uniref:YjdF family protein n=1 Tax=Aminipila sp. TaxID=2060095 RepID=UPI0028A19A59|nr:YjdF family protein [Aminipila sp.]
MGSIVSKFTVFFDEPFWVGIFEREEGTKYEACKITFGAEPKDYVIYEFMLKNQKDLKFSPGIDINCCVKRCKNPKRMKREIRKQVNSSACIGTKAQQALKLQHEQMKTIKKVRSKEQKEAEKERLFELKQKKRKQKHRGH